MKLTSKPVMAGALAFAITGAGLFAALPANAQVPGQTDTYGHELGSVVFYDATGHALTGGTNLSHLADYVGASAAGRTNASKATLYFANPDPNQPDPAGWSQASASASTNFPLAAPAPFNLVSPQYSNPVVTAGATDANLQSFMATRATSTTAGYQNIWEVRLRDSGVGLAIDNSHWFSTFIQVNPTAGTWSVYSPAMTVTNATIAQTAGPASPQATTSGGTTSSITLKATETPANSGWFQFYDGATALGSPVAVDATGAASYTDTPAAVAAGGADAVHQYSAQFLPTGGTMVGSATTPNFAYTVTAPKTATTTAVSVTGAATAYSQQTLVATVAPAGATGSVAFSDSGTALSGTVTKGTSASGDTYTLVTSALGQGSHTISAAFTATGTYSSSNGSAPAFTLAAPTCPGDPNAYPNGNANGCTTTGNVQTTVTPGYLTISTPYSSTVPFVMPALALNGAGTLLSMSGTFPEATKAPLTVVSTLAGDPNWTASVVCTDLTGTGKTTPTGTNDKIDGRNVGLDGWATGSQTNTATVVSYTPIPAANPSGLGVQPSDTATTGGVKSGPTAFATTTGGGNGTVTARGTMTINAPTNTVADTYTGTITFSVA